MGDLSAEPSMEDILASIKRVIKEGEAPSAAPRRITRPAPEPVDDDAVLELDASMTPPPPLRSPPPPPRAASTPSADVAPPPRDDVIDTVSPATVQATRGALDSLSRLFVKPEPESDGTLEGLVRDMLRPMLSAWLDANLPPLVEQMVAREIAKITAGQR